jgi:hypothetical protein
METSHYIPISVEIDYRQQLAITPNLKNLQLIFSPVFLRINSL